MNFDLPEFDHFLFKLNYFDRYEITSNGAAIYLDIYIDNDKFPAGLEFLVYDLNKIYQYWANFNITPKVDISGELQISVTFEKQLLKGYAQHNKEAARE